MDKLKEKTVIFKDNGMKEIDKKLEEYLSIHSMNLTSSVRNYVERSKKGKLSEEEQISQLGLVAYERKKFLKTIQIIEDKFQRRVNQINKVAKSKARQGIDLIMKQCSKLFKDEWISVVGQYNEMRDGLYTAELELFLSEGQKHYMETEQAELK